MKKFYPDFFSIIFIVAGIHLVLSWTIDLFGQIKNDLSDYLLIGLHLTIGVGLLYVLSRFKLLTITDTSVNFNSLLKGEIKIKNEDITGIMYKIHVEKNPIYSWKYIGIKCNDSRIIKLEKFYFFSFNKIEKELLKNFSVLVPTTKSILKSNQLLDLNREMVDFDKKIVNRQIIVGLLIGVFIIWLSIFLVMDNEITYSKSIPILIFGLYFIYTSFKNINNRLS